MNATWQAANMLTNSPLCVAAGPFIDATIATLPFLVVKNGFKEMPLPKIRPQRFCYPYLRIGNLPEEKIGNTELAARPNEQIGVRKPSCIEMLGEKGLIDVRHFSFGKSLVNEKLTSVDDFCSAAVVEGDIKKESRIVSS